MKHPTYVLRGRVWLYPGEAAWHFVNVTKKVSEEIKENFSGSKRGFGSIKVKVTVGSTTWSTSIFPDKKTGTYILPLKAKVRKRENINDGGSISYTLEILI